MKCPKCQNGNNRLIDCTAALVTGVWYRCVVCGHEWRVARTETTLSIVTHFEVN